VKKKVDIMERIKEANKGFTTGIEDRDIEHWITIYIMGKEYRVPAGLTIMQAMEYAGYRFIRGAGCRAGFCGACSTLYRLRGDYKLKADLACQTRAEDGMYLVQIPFVPAERAVYTLGEERPTPQLFQKYYPEIARCVQCNTCTKACPQDLEAMDIIQYAIRGDIAGVAELSFDCIQCGLCAARCPAEIVHYHLAQLGRRVYGKYLVPEEVNVGRRVSEIEEGKYEKDYEDVMSKGAEELKRMYLSLQEHREV